MNFRRAFVFLSLLLGCARPQRDAPCNSAAAPPTPQPVAQPPSKPLLEDPVDMLASNDHAIQAARERMITAHLQGRTSPTRPSWPPCAACHDTNSWTPHSGKRTTAGLYSNATLLPVIKNNKDYELVGIASSGGLHAQHSGKKFGFQYATSSDEDILNDPKINTVAILTRHDSHANLVLKALTAGKHVFVEKPLAITPKQLELVRKALVTHPSPLVTVGFNRRFSPLTQQLHSLLVARHEPLHAHYRVNAGYIPLNHRTQDPALGGGRIIGEACHFIDMLTFLVGAAPISVAAHALPDGGKYHDDNVSMTFTFPDGSIWPS